MAPVSVFEVTWCLLIIPRISAHAVTCDSDFSELTYSLSILICPPDCWRQESNLCGNGAYSSGPICLAAIQDLIIDNFGGIVQVYRSDNTFQTKGGFRNGVQSSTCSSKDISFTFQMTCRTNGNAQQAVNNVWCPSGCGSELVRGSDIYHIGSSVCAAAIHNGLLTAEGGYLTFYRIGDVRFNFTGTTRNGVTSVSAGESLEAFTFQFVDECQLSDGLCENNATCIDLIAGYACQCTAGYKGHRCETVTDINDCTPNPCQNGATCSNNVGSYSCACAAGYTGEQCQTDINECSPNPCQNGATCSDNVGSYSCACAAGYNGTQCETGCNPQRYCTSGMSDGPQSGHCDDRVYCNQGWTIIQRRFNGSVDFNLNWNEYVSGFGSSSGEFWKGLEQIHQLTFGKNCVLRFDLWDFNSSTSWQEYSVFQVQGAATNYTINISGTTGTAGDAMSLNTIYSAKNMAFSTKDADHDGTLTRNCASIFDGGWWYQDCYSAKLNAPYGNSVGRYSYIQWLKWGNGYRPLAKTRIGIRNCTEGG